jgi:phenylacetate-CoA ligase
VPVLSLLQNMRRMKKSANLEAEEVKTLRERRLHSLLGHVLTKSKFYRSYYADHGISAENVKGARLEDLPTIDKNVMMEHYDDFVCDPVLKREDLEKFISDPANRGKKYKESYEVVHTSGSSGTIGLFVYGPGDWDMLRALVLTRVSKTRINPLRKAKLAFIGATDGHFAGMCLVQGAPRSLMSVLPLSINSPLKEICQEIDRFQPHTISGYSSGIHLLAQEQIKGNINIHPRRILGAADPLTLKMRQTIVEAFGIQPVNFYAASESIGMAADCDTHQGLHLFDDWHCFEVVDDNMQPVKPGEPGKLLLTNLYNYTQPLLRYQMQDEIVLDDKPCECGCPFPVIKGIAGRQEEFLWFEKPDGTKEFIHPIVIVEFFVPGLEKLQVIQTEGNRLSMKVMIHGDRGNAISAIRKRMTEILEGKGLEKFVGFEVQVVDNIENDPQTGKFKLVVALKRS